jgi:integrase
MGSKIHERIAPGIYRLVNGSFRVKVGVGEMARGGRQRETAFPPGSSLREMKAWQTTTRAALLREDIRPAKGTLAADIDGYVERVRGRMPSWKARRSDLKNWVPRFGNRLRHTITPEEVDDQLKTWKAAGVAIWSCNHRRSALAMLYKELDGETAHNPAAKTKRFAPPLAIPQALAYEVIERTLGRIEPCVTKAMLGIMAYCGFRPSEIRRAHRENVLPFIGAEQPFVQRLTSKKGRPVALPVPAQGVTYWRMFDQFNG